MICYSILNTVKQKYLTADFLLVASIQKNLIEGIGGLHVG